MKKDWEARREEISRTDRALWAEGRAFAGIDEAGRGPLCGPVAAACVVMPPEPLLLYVDDSKKLTEKRREALYDQIMETAVYARVALASPQDIDRMNILQATKWAMAEAAKDAPCELFLVDLKVMSSEKHKFWTGVPNERILDNIRHLAEIGGDFFIRIPLIREVNADDDNIEASAAFLASIPWKRKEVNLLPYHDIGKGKHERMWQGYNPEGYAMSTPSVEEQQHCISVFEKYGIKAIIGG